MFQKGKGEGQKFSFHILSKSYGHFVIDKQLTGYEVIIPIYISTHFPVRKSSSKFLGSDYFSRQYVFLSGGMRYRVEVSSIY